MAEMNVATLVLLAVAAIALAGTLMLYHHWIYERQSDDGSKPLPGGTNGALNPLMTAAAIPAEAVGFLLVIVTWPLRFIHDAMPFRARIPGENPIVLVHGWGANSACFFFVQLWLKARGYGNVYAVSCSPAVIDARKLAAQLSCHIDEALAATGAQKVTLIAHSMGGLLSRYAIRNLGCDAKVERVITLGSPHMGSKVAGMVPGFGNVPQMRYQSAFIRELAAGGMTPGADVQYFSIYSEFDNFVLPNHSSVLDGNAQNIHVPWHGHCALLYSPVVMRHIEDILGAPENAARASS